jgi:hypothetical protein
MSYDLMVFDVKTALKGRKEFLEWHGQLIEWEEDHSYENLEVTTPELRSWFMEIIQTFPPMNGPLSRKDLLNADDSSVTDYSFGRTALWAAFAWSKFEQAYKTVFQLSGKHGVGFYDASSNDGEVWLPTVKGTLMLAHSE